MDGSSLSITPTELYQQLGTAQAPIDVRRSADIGADNRGIMSARRRDPEDVARWAKDLPVGSRIGVHCVHGWQVSQDVAAVLRERGLDARYLEGGIVGWRESDLPTRRLVAPTPGTWVTRERPKIDRIACPWLIDPACDFGSYERWRAEFVAMGKALGGGSGWVLLAWSPRDHRLVNRPITATRSPAARRSSRSTCTSIPITWVSATRPRAKSRRSWTSCSGKISSGCSAI